MSDMKPYKMPDGVQTRLVMIDAERAYELLTGNDLNRNIRWGLVAWLIERIKRGEWQLINNGIGIGKDGKLYDGQHRLLAIAEAAPPGGVPCFITTGLSPEARPMIDKGNPRAISDELAMMHGIKNAKARVAYLRLCVNLAAGRLTHGGSSIPLRSSAEYFDLLPLFQDGIEWSVKCFLENPAPPQVRAAGIAGVLALAYATSPEKIAVFGRQLRDGEGLTKGMPAYAMRDVLLRDVVHGTLKRDPASNTRKLLTAAMMHVKGEQATKLMDGEVGAKYFVRQYADSRKLKALAAAATAAAEHGGMTAQKASETAVDRLRAIKVRSSGSEGRRKTG